MGKQRETATSAATGVTSPPPSAAPSSSRRSTTKISFRARKIRKLNPNSKEKTTTNENNESPPPPQILVLPRPLTSTGELSAALSHLRSADSILASVIASHPPPSFESYPSRSPFHSLARSILYQQLAFKAATVIYTRFLSLFNSDDGPLPLSVLAISAQQLRQIGVSARKASYLHDLASKFHSGVLSDSAVLAMDDDSLLSMLTAVKGIGTWTVHMFMIFSLHRPDVLPVGDLGVRKGVQMLYGLKEVPTPALMEELCGKWRPYRSVGAWYMWRLVESKGTPTMASASAEVVTNLG